MKILFLYLRILKRSKTCLLDYLYINGRVLCHGPVAVVGTCDLFIWNLCQCPAGEHGCHIGILEEGVAAPACLSLPPLSSVPCGDPDVAGRVIHAHTLRKVPIWPCTSTLSPGSAHTQSMGGRETTMILVGIQWHLLTSVR